MRLTHDACNRRHWSLEPTAGAVVELADLHEADVQLLTKWQAHNILSPSRQSVSRPTDNADGR